MIPGMIRKKEKRKGGKKGKRRKSLWIS